MNWIDYKSAKPIAYSRKHFLEFPKENTFYISSKISILLRDNANLIGYNPYKLEEQEEFIQAAKSITKHFSKDIKNNILYSLNSFGASLIKGLPIEDDIPDTPIKGGVLPTNYKSSFLYEALLIAIGNITGAELFNFRQEGRGTAPLIDNIVPVPELKNQKGAGGYENNFPFHCESAWHRKRPDYLVLYGIRENVEANTLVYSSQNLFSNADLVKDLLDSGEFELKAPDLYIQMEKSGMPMGTPKTTLVFPVQKERNCYKLNVNFNGMNCKDRKAIESLFEFENHVELKAVGTIISPGSALILNNNITCHTRTGYTPNFDGKDRWFLRGYFRRNLWQDDFSIQNANNGLLNAEMYKKILAKGWITKQSTFSHEFMQYMLSPDKLSHLSDDEMSLASMAFHLTPLKNCRIV